MASRVIGAREHSRRLERMRGAGARRKVGDVLFAVGEMVQVDAQISITTGAVSGAGHVPSTPGQPPNADTHRLADNIETVQPKPLRVEVSSNAPYSAALEFGSSRVAARPFMKPAADRNRGAAAKLLRRAGLTK